MAAIRDSSQISVISDAEMVELLKSPVRKVVPRRGLPNQDMSTANEDGTMKSQISSVVIKDSKGLIIRPTTSGDPSSMFIFGVHVPPKIQLAVPKGLSNQKPLQTFPPTQESVRRPLQSMNTA